MTDEQIWAIICAPFSKSSVFLAENLGLPISTVARIRLKFRREGWTCRVNYVPCTVCGALLTNNVETDGFRAAHPHCSQIPGASFLAIYADRQKYLYNSSHTSPTSGKPQSMPWTESDDAVLIACNAGDTVQTMARLLGRSSSSIRSRRTKLRLDGRLD